MSKRILIIPSWYPTLKQPLNGSFFQEQARFLQGNANLEIHLLYGEKKSTPLLRWIWMFVQSWLNSTWPISKEKVQQDPPAFGFYFPANRRVPDALRIQLEQRLFWKAYQSLIRTGWKPDLIHAQSGMDAGIFANHISNRANIPFVLIEHQVVIFHHYSKNRASLVLSAYRNAHRLGAVSQAQKRQMLMHEPMCNPFVVPNLVDETKFRLSDRSLLSSFQILTIMYPHTIKGFRTFFEAMKNLKEKGMNFEFKVVGKGGELFRQEIQEMGLSGHGQLIEELERNEIAEVFAKSHVYVCSSDFETFGIAPREAMICGLPVVSTANGGVEDGITPEIGLIVPVRNAEAMADAILQIKMNYSKYDPNAIRKLAVAQCGKESFLRSMLSFYNI
ncbi:glycosyltransferase [Mariniradius sediminis]|uniref:Glycosyltransferase n=1 Tax=Mariniradius sediminis TaxID=2909237 RepID=A0ABS9BQH9_9BACT|nr:glycosyltransferase [Mariniradius sediminis]MCF1750309.1 glycosyltransferase [Mariniradius sediminis]